MMGAKTSRDNQPKADTAQKSQRDEGGERNKQLKINDRKNQDPEILRLGYANNDQKNPNPESAKGRNGIGSL